MKRFALVAVVLAVRLCVIGGNRFVGNVSVFLRASGGMWFARECPDCRSLWPSESDFFKCPQCGVDTRTVQKRPMTSRDATRRLRGIEFERWYQERERNRVGLSPENRGREQAARDLEEIRRLERLLDG